MDLFTDKCIPENPANCEQCKDHESNSVRIITLFEKALELAYQALLSNSSAREALIKENILSETEIDQLIIMEKSTKTGYTG